MKHATISATCYLKVQLCRHQLAQVLAEIEIMWKLSETSSQNNRIILSNHRDWEKLYNWVTPTVLWKLSVHPFTVISKPKGRLLRECDNYIT